MLCDQLSSAPDVIVAFSVVGKPSITSKAHISHQARNGPAKVGSSAWLGLGEGRVAGSEVGLFCFAVAVFPFPPSPSPCHGDAWSGVVPPRSYSDR